MVREMDRKRKKIEKIGEMQKKFRDGLSKLMKGITKLNILLLGSGKDDDSANFKLRQRARKFLNRSMIVKSVHFPEEITVTELKQIAPDPSMVQVVEKLKDPILKDYFLTLTYDRTFVLHTSAGPIAEFALFSRVDSVNHKFRVFVPEEKWDKNSYVCRNLIEFNKRFNAVYKYKEEAELYEKMEEALFKEVGWHF